MTSIPHLFPLCLALLGAGGNDGATPQRTKSSTAAGPPSLLTPVVNGVRVDPFSPLKPFSDEPVLRPAKDGSGDLLYDASGFVARVTPDGTVNFRDKHFSALSLIPFWPTASVRNLPSMQAAFGALMRGRAPPRVDDSQTNDGSGMVIPLLSRYRPDPREACRACGRAVDAMPLNLTGRFDLTDEVMRMSSQDPYRYDKAKFLVATRELRVRKAAQRHAEYIRGAADELSGRLQAIACDDRRTLRERRRIIELLRDELDGATPEARVANQTITGFLETHLDPSDAGNDACSPTGTAPPPVK